jgi:hypothetical protein
MALDNYFRDDDFWAELRITMRARRGVSDPNFAATIAAASSPRPLQHCF